MLHLKCRYCGEDRLSLMADGQVATCSYCRKQNVVPRGYTRAESLFLAAEDCRTRLDFDRAVRTYNEILSQDAENAAALWGIALSRHQVEYLRTGNGYRLTCHKIDRASFSDDPDAKKAMRLAKGEEAALYRRDAEEINRLQTAVASLSRLDLAYDVVLGCAAPYGESYSQAQRIVGLLEEEEYSVLFLERDLKNESPERQEARRIIAQSTAAMMLYVSCGSPFADETALLDATRFARQLKAGLCVVKKRSDSVPQELASLAKGSLDVDNSRFADNLLDRLDYALEEEADDEEAQFTNLLNQAGLFLEQGAFQKAAQQYNEVLNIDMEECLAYWGLLLAELGCKNEKELIAKGLPVWERSNFNHAMEYANDNQRRKWNQVVEQIRQTYTRQQQELAHQEQSKETYLQKIRQEEEVKRQEVKLKEEKLQSEAVVEKKSPGCCFIVFAILMILGLISAFAPDLLGIRM